MCLALGSRIRGMWACIHHLCYWMLTLVADVDDELVFEKLLNSLECLSTLEVSDAGDELFGDVLMITHANLDGC